LFQGIRAPDYRYLSVTDRGFPDTYTERGVIYCAGWLVTRSDLFIFTVYSIKLYNVKYDNSCNEMAKTLNVRDFKLERPLDDNSIEKGSNCGVPDEPNSSAPTGKSQLPTAFNILPRHQEVPLHRGLTPLWTQNGFTYTLMQLGTM
jgi:hypothetical protein